MMKIEKIYIKNKLPEELKLDNKKNVMSKKNTNDKINLVAKAFGNQSKGNRNEKEITDWFYMTPKEVTAKMISNLLQTQSNVVVDLWEEMNILQLELPSKISVDFEPIIINFRDPADAEFVENRDIKTIFEVTMEEAVLQEMKELLRIIINEWDGFLCADSDDFQPIFGKEDL